MNWLQLVIAGAISAFVTWLACWRWYRRKLMAPRQKLEHALPTVPSSELSRPQSSPKTELGLSAESIEELERELNEASNTTWERARPFLDTSPLTHVVEEKTPGDAAGSNEIDVDEVTDPGSSGRPSSPTARWHTARLRLSQSEPIFGLEEWRDEQGAVATGSGL